MLYPFRIDLEGKTVAEKSVALDQARDFFLAKSAQFREIGVSIADFSNPASFPILAEADGGELLLYLTLSCGENSNYSVLRYSR